jgi:pyruvate/2-oxoglutarate/acetoin dehydrogenase E1 component
MSNTFKNVPQEKLVEFPVAEDMQLGLCIGASLVGDRPVCIYPRWSFLLLAINQLVLHLDKLSLYSEYRPNVIIRTAVPSAVPLDPGPQHLGNFSRQFQLMLNTVNVVVLNRADEIVPQYELALMNSRSSTILVERTELYA